MLNDKAQESCSPKQSLKAPASCHFPLSWLIRYHQIDSNRLVATVEVVRRGKTTKQLGILTFDDAKTWSEYRKLLLASSAVGEVTFRNVSTGELEKSYGQACS